MARQFAVELTPLGGTGPGPATITPDKLWPQDQHYANCQYDALPMVCRQAVDSF